MFPKLIDTGGFYLPSYGVLVACGFLAALWIISRLGRRAGLHPDKLSNLAIYTALAGLAGAKLTMFAFDWEIYANNPSELFSLATLQSAGVYQGGFVLAFVASIALMRHYQLPALPTMDLFAPAIALGHGIGRIGCFAAGCCWGVKCDRPWAVEFTSVDAGRLTGVPLGVPLHPTQLYEAVAEFLIFGGLMALWARRPRPGTVIGLYLVLYSAVRFFVEFYRTHMQALPFGLPFSLTQYFSIAMALLGIGLLVWRARPSTAPAR